MKIGTRYFSRGVDTNGYVSNFVETEQLIATPSKSEQQPGVETIYSHIQIRGSIPLFWRQVINVKYQPALQLLSHPATVFFLLSKCFLVYYGSG